MLVSVLGTGRMGARLVELFSKEMKVLWGSRTPEKARAIIEEKELNNVTAVTYEEALAGDVIVHTLWFRDVLPWAEAHRQQLAGKIFIDPSNPFTEDFTDFTLDWGQSSAEELQRLLPETYVVGAFKNTFFKVLEQPVHQGLISDIYVTGDHEDAKQAVIALLEAMPFRVMDGGRLLNNRTIERMTLFSREMAVRGNHYPYVSFRLFGV